MVRQLLQISGNTVIAACRTPSNATALQSLADGASGKLHIVKMDTSDENSIEETVTSVKEICLHPSGLLQIELRCTET